jgi:hypothetical protein
VATLGDEMSVAIGDKVKVIRSFDDGWALVERVSEGVDAATTQGKKKPGLIPIDCMRAIGQDLPTFLYEKRVSSTYAISVRGMAF